MGNIKDKASLHVFLPGVTRQGIHYILVYPGKSFTWFYFTLFSIPDYFPPVHGKPLLGRGVRLGIWFTEGSFVMILGKQCKERLRDLKETPHL